MFGELKNLTARKKRTWRSDKKKSMRGATTNISHSCFSRDTQHKHKVSGLVIIELNVNEVNI